MEQDAASAKQQLVETLRNATSVVITTPQQHDNDQVAAALGLRLLLGKLDKVAEVVITQPLSEQLSFLPTDMVNQTLQGQRDFVVELDQSRVEADSLRYVTEDNKLKIYITPYNGSFSQDDASFSYGDYHCDAIIGLGVSHLNDIDEHIRTEEKLAQNTPFMFISDQQGTPDAGAQLNWADDNASSVCEMIMSMSEALGSGMLDEDIATALLTGIIDKTNHFTNSSTTPKVMTMSAQLLAAGARQSQIIEQLQQTGQQPPESQAKQSKPSQPEDTTQPQSPPNEFQIRKQQSDQQPAESKTKADSSQSVHLRQNQPDQNQTPPQSEQAQQPPSAPSTPAQTSSQPSQPGASQSSPGPQQGPGDKQSVTVGGTPAPANNQPPQQPRPQQPPPNNPAEQQPQPTPPPQPSSPPQSAQQQTSSGEQDSSEGSGKKVVSPPPGADRPPPDKEALMAALQSEGGNQPPPANPQQQPPPPNNATPQQQPSQPNTPPPAPQQPNQSDGGQRDVNSARRAVEQALQDDNQQQ